MPRAVDLRGRRREPTRPKHNFDKPSYSGEQSPSRYPHSHIRGTEVDRPQSRTYPFARRMGRRPGMVGNDCSNPESPMSAPGVCSVYALVNVVSGLHQAISIDPCYVANDKGDPMIAVYVQPESLKFANPFARRISPRHAEDSQQLGLRRSAPARPRAVVCGVFVSNGLVRLRPVLNFLSVRAVPSGTDPDNEPHLRDASHRGRER